jgi:uncharacterized protein
LNSDDIPELRFYPERSITMPNAIPKDKMEGYRKSARRRSAERATRLQELRKRAMTTARQAADLLKKEYGVEAVYLFGSLAEKFSVFDERSDVDLAVRGLDEAVYYRVVSHLLDLDHALDVDLIQMETAPESLVVKIEKKGIRL